MALLDPLPPASSLRLLSLQLQPRRICTPTGSFSTCHIPGNGTSVFQVPGPDPGIVLDLAHPPAPSAGLTFEIYPESNQLLPAPLLPFGPAPITSCRDYSFLFSQLPPQQQPEGSCQNQSQTSALPCSTPSHGSHLTQRQSQSPHSRHEAPPDLLPTPISLPL